MSLCVFSAPLIGVPKYRQNNCSVEKAIEKVNLVLNKLPSANKVCLESSLSRDTVLQAYEELKKRGIIFAIPRLLYKSVEVTKNKGYFLLFDELNISRKTYTIHFIENIAPTSSGRHFISSL
jgi:DNA-binding transcriptional MocR family regulator